MRMRTIMKTLGLRCLLIGAITYSPWFAYAENSMYCPQRHGYINVGMTSEEVLNACGSPIIKRASGNAVLKNIPVTQLIYSNLNRGALFDGWTTAYNQWSLPSGSLGITLQVELIDDKVKKITIDGNSTNAASICNEGNFQIGDNLEKVVNACGSPSMVNNTYISMPVSEREKPEVWIYQINEYQPGFSLTFINGKLQSINN